MAMDKHLFEKYINEMKQMQKKAVLPADNPVVMPNPEREDATELIPNFSKPLSDYEEQPESEMTGKGFLLVNVT